MNKYIYISIYLQNDLNRKLKNMYVFHARVLFVCTSALSHLSDGFPTSSNGKLGFKLVSFFGSGLQIFETT